MIHSALVRYSRISEDVSRDLLYKLRDFEDGHPEFLTFDSAAFLDHLRKIVDDRLAFANRQVAMAEDLLGGLRRSRLGGEDDLPFRMVSARSYYGVHHALRAMLMEVYRSDPDTHESTLTLARRFLQNTPDAQASFGPMNVYGQSKKLLNERHVADYHFYNQNGVAAPVLEFAVCAPASIPVAKQIIGGCDDVIQKRRVGAFT